MTKAKNSRRWQQPVLFLAIIGGCILLGLWLIARPKAATPFPTSRDKYTWPFSRYSPWNMPIGDKADLKPAGLPNNYPEFVIETNFISVDQSAPVKTATNTNSNQSYQVHVTNSLESAIGGKEGNFSGNKCAAFLNADNTTINMGQPAWFEGGSVKWAFECSFQGDNGSGWSGPPITITGDGIRGCQGGSGMSGLGGAIRAGELSSDQPIRHALKILVYCHETCAPYQNKGYRWPAVKADDYWQHGNNSWCPQCGPQNYAGNVPDVTMGSLLTLKADEDLSWVTDPRAKKVAEAIKTYGIYIVDDSATNKFHIAADVETMMQDFGGDSFLSNSTNRTFRDELLALMPKLQVVANNAPTAIGGGGNPRACLAPPFNNGTDEIAANPNGAVQEPAGCSGGTVATPTPTALPSGTDNPGDIDGDGHATFTDLTILVVNYKKTGVSRQQGDLDGDGTVTIFDLSRLVKYWGT